jgi:hypothetical protein
MLAERWAVTGLRRSAAKAISMSNITVAGLLNGAGVG